MNAVYALANQLLSELAPACARAGLAGSIRRGKPDPKDIEVVCIPRLVSETQPDLFGGSTVLATVSRLDEAVRDLVAGDWEFDPVVRRNGERYKRLRHRAARNHLDAPVALDLFITDAKGWGILYTIRTGPGDFSKALVSLALERGWFVDGNRLHRHRRQYKQDRTPLPCQRGDDCSLILPTPEERDVFEALAIPWMEPAQRSVAELALRLKLRG